MTLYIVTDLSDIDWLKYIVDEFIFIQKAKFKIEIVKEAKKYLAEGHFAEGSMAPKMRAAIEFVENGGKRCIITQANELGKPNTGTRIVLN